MSDQISRKSVLFNRLLEGKLSATELEELVKWLAAENPDAEAADLVLQQLKQTGSTQQQIPADIIQKLEAKLPLILGEKKQRTGVLISMFRQKWLRYAAAIILVGAIGLLFFLTNKSTGTDNKIAIVQPVTPEQIQPGKDGAILTLADGTKVVLDSLGNGLITTQQGTKVSLVNGQLVYDAANAGTPVETVYNIMSTPKGRQFHLVLPDGSKVWLNAASSIRYPIVFAGSERKVEITGEAYFEVSPLPASPGGGGGGKKPFIVQKGDVQVTVLGTHFNVNSYDNEEDIKVTLLEGSVRVSNETAQFSRTIKPGEQAILSHQSQPSNQIPVQTVDVDKVMAWKNGFFNFQDASLQEVMRQLERWYDIEVMYEKNVPKLEFFGKMGKDLSLAAVLSGLEKSNVHFRMEEGRKLVVLP